MASFFSTSSPPFHLTPRVSPLLRTIPCLPQVQKGWNRRLVVISLKCLPGPGRDAESEVETRTEPSSSTSTGISLYNWCAGIGGLGFLETAYLTYTKLSDSDAFCPVAGGTCGEVLKSDYAVVFGVPLPLVGMIAYGLVTALGLKLAGNNLPFEIGKTNGRLVLLGITTSMAAASAYFLYILSTKFAGVSCSYCLGSALLSFSLFFITVKGFGWQEIQNSVGLQLCVAGLVVTALTTSYNSLQPLSSSLAETELPYFPTEIMTESSPLTLSLARHLQSIGAKMYGAFWCSHCIEQKQMFGREAAKLLDYVECFPDGFKKGTKIAKACANVGIEGFPTWVINGQVLSGEQDLSELAKVSGFELEELTLAN